MNLLLDLGNSRCKFEVLEQAYLKSYGILAYPKKHKPSVIEALLVSNPDISKVIICSVLRAALNKELVKLLNKHGIDDYYFVDPVCNSFAIELSYADPACLGADRLAALIAANEKFDGGKCIVDCGTAVTIDALDAKGRHCGGVILPGLASMQHTLSVDTAIKHSEPSKKFDVLSTTTQDAIHTGCVSAIVGGIQYVVEAMQRNASFPRVIVTGGGAVLVLDKLSQKVEHEPALVLDGLKIIMQNL